MPQRMSGKKELRKNEKRHKKNIAAKQKIKTTVKKLKKSLEDKDFPATEQIIKEVYKTLDKVAHQGLIHRNKAARKKSRIAKLINRTKSKTSV